MWLFVFMFQQFVSDRKIDEELGSTTRFMADFDALKEVNMGCITGRSTNL